jgi:hypothetical protein
MHNVAVRQNEAIGREDETGTAPAAASFIFHLYADHCRAD